MPGVSRTAVTGYSGLASARGPAPLPPPNLTPLLHRGSAGSGDQPVPPQASGFASKGLPGIAILSWHVPLQAAGPNLGQPPSADHGFGF